MGGPTQLLPNVLGGPNITQYIGGSHPIPNILKFPIYWVCPPNILGMPPQSIGYAPPIYWVCRPQYYEYFKNNQYLRVCCCGTWFFCEHRYLGCRVISQTIWDWDSLGHSYTCVKIFREVGVIKVISLDSVMIYFCRSTVQRIFLNIRIQDN